MKSQPRWHLDEMKQLTVEYTNLAEVQAYDARRHQIMSVQEIQAENEAIINHLNLEPDQAVLDMGTGTGTFALVAAKYCAKVYAVDIAPTMLDRARQKAKKAGLTNIEFLQGGFLSYEHQADPVDAIVAKFVLHQIPDFWKMIALKHVGQFLKEGGRLYVIDVVFSFPAEDYEDRFKGWIDWWHETVPEMVPHAERHLREKHSTFGWIMEGVLTQAGFTIDKAECEDFVAEYVCTKTGL